MCIGSKPATVPRHIVGQSRIMQWRDYINVLTNIDPPYDPLMGTYQLRGILCRVRKLEEGKSQETIDTGNLIDKITTNTL